MTQEKTLTLDRSAWFVRWAEWAYDSPADADLNFCELFWLLVLSPIVAVCRLIGLGAKAIKVAPVVVAAAERGGDRVAESAQAHPRFWKVVGYGALALLFLYAVGAIFYALYQAAWWALLIPGNVACLVYVLYLCRHTRLVRVLAAAYRAWKTRTCPRVEFTERAA